MEGCTFKGKFGTLMWLSGTLMLAFFLPMVTAVPSERKAVDIKSGHI